MLLKMDAACLDVRDRPASAWIRRPVYMYATLCRYCFKFSNPVTKQSASSRGIGITRADTIRETGIGPGGEYREVVAESCGDLVVTTNVVLTRFRVAGRAPAE